ncbi:TCP-1/cpn60 chaperonin family protein, partial [Tanacetum coccineum]
MKEPTPSPSWRGVFIPSLRLVEAQTQVELKDKQLRMEDAVNATKREEGVVVGGGVGI